MIKLGGEIMDFTNVVGVIGITIICYLVGLAVKASGLDNKWIPIIVGVLGAVLGVLGMYFMPDFPANNIIDALAVGIVSGLASTGADQIVKQLTKSD